LIDSLIDKYRSLGAFSGVRGRGWTKGAADLLANTEVVLKLPSSK
jgi:hypothetical protein